MRSRMFFLEPKILRPSADKQSGGVLDPVAAEFLPGPPPFRKPLVHKQRFEVGDRDCGFAVDCGGTGLVGEKREQETEFTGSPNKIVLAKQLRELLLEISVSIDRIVLGRTQSFNEGWTNSTDKSIHVG